MLRPRIIPCLLIHDHGLVKTRRFAEPAYVGDPINAVRIFNEKEVDELLVVDIDATVNSREPDYDLIAKLAAESRMPLAYGGGVNKLEQVERIIQLGVEKVAISTSAVSNPGLITAAAQKVGSQSVAVVADVRRVNGSYDVFTHNGTRRTGLTAVDVARRAEEAGAGELVVNNIDRDGMATGYDLDLVAECRQATGLPITVLGGAGSLDDIRALVARFPIIGAAAGSLFVFKGKYRAVLINYPDRVRKDEVLSIDRQFGRSIFGIAQKESRATFRWSGQMAGQEKTTSDFSIGRLRTVFDAVAQDFPVREYMQAYSRIQVEEVCRSLNTHLGSFDGKRLLDVGSGPMDKTAVFARLGFHTFAVDDLSDPWHQTPGMVNAITAFARRQGVTFHRQTPDNYVIPFDAGTFDVVTSIAVIEHLHDTPRVILNAMGEQLRPHGILAVVMPNSVNLRKRLSVLAGQTNYNPLGEMYYSIGGYRGHVREYTLGETVQICRWSGFEVLEARTFEHLAQYKLKGLAQLLYLKIGDIIPGLRSSLLVICRKPNDWKPSPEDPDRYFEAISEAMPTRISNCGVNYCTGGENRQ